MPIYEFDCAQHGTFEVSRTVARRAEVALCPACELPATRLLSAPALAILSRSERIARDRNQRSRHEPQVTQKPSRTASQSREPERKAPLQRGHGRPWALEHG